MKVDQLSANKIWNAYFGAKSSFVDPFGHIMHRNRHGFQNEGGWEVDHIWSRNAENGFPGANIYDNIQPLSWYSNSKKANKMQGKIDNVTFAVCKEYMSEDGRVGRMMIKEKEEWYWAYDEPNY